jgi:AcrR family transcriptional regulator
MGDKVVRNPIKKTSIEKKNKIIELGFKLMCEKGYYNVNCADIAKYAYVSTGIIYQYFNDKKDIFIEGVKNYYDSIMYPMYDVLSTNINKNDLSKTINDLIDVFIKTHNISKSSHENLMAMSYTMEEVKEIFNDNEMILTNKISEILKKEGFIINNPLEKIHISIGIVDNFCHEVVYHKHESLDYDVMKKEVIDLIIGLLKRD